MFASVSPPAPGVSLTPSERRAFERDGFLVREAVFGDAELASMRQAFDRLEARGAGLGASADRDGARYVVAPTGLGGALAVQRVVWCGGAEPSLFGPALDPRILSVAMDLLGTDRASQIVHQAHFKRPSDGVRFELHQDAWNRRHGTALWRPDGDDGAYVQCVLTVDPMRSDNGPLLVCPGSHRAGPILGPDRHRRAAWRAAETGVHPVVAPAGSVVFFGPFLIHGSDPNRGDQPRRVLVSGFARVGVNRRPYPGAGLGVRRSRPSPSA